MSSPPTRYARSGDVSIAYQTVGDGPIDVVLVLGFRETELLNGRPSDLPFVGGGDVGEQDAHRRAGDAHDDEEVLVDRNQADRE